MIFGAKTAPIFIMHFIFTIVYDILTRKEQVTRQGGFMDIVILVCVILAVIFSFLAFIFAIRKSDNKDAENLRKDFANEAKNTRMEVSNSVRESVKDLGEMLGSTQKQTADMQQTSLQNFQTTVSDLMTKVDKRLEVFSKENEQKLENIRTTVQRSIASMQEDNNRQLTEMRNTVDEKLQKTLDDKLTKSFATVSERLEAVYKGLGEMQNIATGVGDLKKVLSNVKTRGILGEIQLGAILEEILSPEQYVENVATAKNSTERVEFAVLLPADDGKQIYLPIDAKFPADVYSNLVDAYETANPEQVEIAKKALVTRIKGCAKDIRDKYIDPPYTTDFAIMFLPFEGLYSEVVRLGMVEALQKDFKICIAGPTTMAALLNSLQMGFKTLAIQKRTSEVWEVLGAVKTEFDKFGEVLEATQQRINQANEQLDKLVGVRTRQIQRKLKSVSSLPDTRSADIIGLLDTDE